ncbi:serine/threonine-protein kinase [Streptomyces gilvosporeus]|uniref:non-specific serine/threonine protein kinase n=1 Tax=Streptomyces gilvosporeus TaxID=553510 RepID=A0A1V0TVT1_9ACTN|nr:serine/threonine-protein kinase [Streptomyces gilvosporeus]ARF56991.1 serine/threonine protein kinase [Streptomyces gilvosporeus]
MGIFGGEGRLVGGRYRLELRLGRGGMGTVWRATDELLGRHVAVKELHLDETTAESEARVQRDRAMREARTVAQVKHPQVIVVHDVVEQDGRPWIVMELVDGPSLADRLYTGGPLAPREAARIGLALLGALRAAHARGVLHRDIKPANVLIESATNRVVLTDFGIAQVPGATTLTEAGGFVGSPEYTAPERMAGRGTGPEADLWSLGVLLCATLSGESPFRRDSIGGVLHAVVYDEIEIPPAARPLLAVVEGLLERDPERRMDIAEAERLLRGYLRTGRTPQRGAPGHWGRSRSAGFDEPAAAGAGPRRPGPGAADPFSDGPDPFSGGADPFADGHDDVDDVHGGGLHGGEPHGDVVPGGALHGGVLPGTGLPGEHPPSEEPLSPGGTPPRPSNEPPPPTGTPLPGAPPPGPTPPPAAGGPPQARTPGRTPVAPTGYGAGHDPGYGPAYGTGYDPAHAPHTPAGAVPGRPGSRSRTPIALLIALAVVVLGGAGAGLTALLMNGNGDPGTQGKGTPAASRDGGHSPSRAESGAESGAPASGTPKPGATVAITSRPSGSNAPKIPTGYVLVHDPAGFSMAVPDGFTRSYEKHRVYYYSQGKRFRIGVQLQKPVPEGPIGAMRTADANGPRDYDGYRQGKVTETTHNGLQAGLWTFVWSGSAQDGGSRYTYDLSWTESGKMIDVWISAPVGSRAEAKRHFDTAVNAFRLTGS